MTERRLASLTLAPLALGLLVAGCALHSRPAPLPAAAPAWPEGVAQGPAAPASGPWWRQFGDPGLDAMVERMLAANGDLAAAGIRLRRAEMATRLAARALLPAASASLDSTGVAALDSDARARSSGATFGVSWEADLFGRLAAARDAQGWEAAATAEDLAATRLALLGTTVIAWWQLGHANERIRLGDESIAYAGRALDLVRVQYGAGFVSRVELRDAEQALAAQEAAQTQLIQARIQARNALAALTGRQDYDGPEPQALPDGPLPPVDPGLPAALLARRPDLAAAEYRLRSLLATVDATRASFYPSFTLTGSAGTSSGSSLAGFLDNPVATLSAFLTLPFLNPERVRLSVGIARADYDAAVATFRQSFLLALADVATAFSARDRFDEQGRALARSLAAAAEAEALYERQYRAGAIPLRQWLDAQERRRAGAAALADNRLNRLSAAVTLFQALGGDARRG